MKIKSILVVLSGGGGDEGRLAQGFALAQSHGSTLAVLHVKPSPLVYATPSEFGMPATVIADIQVGIEATAAGVERMAKQAAEKARVQVDWRCEEGDEPAIAAIHARYVDLAIVAPDLAEDLVFVSSGPVLAFADGLLPRVPKRVLIAWNGSREAGRAVRDALPLLKSATSVDVLVVDPPGERPIGQDLARTLAQHGVKVDLRERIAGSKSAEMVILEEARTSGADLLVMGAYGHSRLREWVLGGATAEALKNTAVPVLLAH